MADVIRDKKTMYAALSRGDFGNTIPQWYDRDQWVIDVARDKLYEKYPLWGVRSLVGGGDSRMQLNVPVRDVWRYVKRVGFGPGEYNISPMIDRWAVLRAEVCGRFDTVPGLYVYYVPPGKIDEASPWRGSFAKYGKQAEGSAARLILETYLGEPDLQNVYRLLEEYPGHTVEFSACDGHLGVIPGHNTIIWEVRMY